MSMVHFIPSLHAGAEVPVREPSGLVIISCRTVDGCKTVIRNYIEYA